MFSQAFYLVNGLQYRKYDFDYRFVVYFEQLAKWKQSWQKWLLHWKKL